MFEKLTSTSYQLSKLDIYNQFDSQKGWADMEARMGLKKVIPLFSRKVLQYAAAILLPLILVGGLSYYFINTQDQMSTIADIDQYVKPGVEKATLILSNGEQVELTQDEINIEEKGTRIAYMDKRLQYETDIIVDEIKEPVYNQLVTPRGGTYSLQLADGTMVTLNAGSELRFPVDFTDSVRRVYLKGEAYFDVTHTGKPFIVDVEKADVRVLGTVFNITAYEDEKQITTTLVEGKVAFEKRIDGNTLQQNFVLTPGLQAVMQKADESVVMKEVNTANYTSWVSGKMEFNKERLELVMRKLARWYDFEYEFENPSAKDFHFTARFDRANNISEVFEILEMTTNV
ncbi:MAG: iron dicitrate transport regulator FecR, partial [Salinivirgaceae bacterium]